ncbi:DUF421 domain-containing protein [Clostridium sp. D2Q-11]|uniref:DUF421 domain-containing protein n=1 Tax=Anaeromonas frigoriresistens TaxID=2683708 RepID=A0A942UTN7_9FIRM|nr:YetF domain-containing protein [Anaeromonas frigoriresistens]MBS4539039.1 DUF421 domain-containing protein [Anaeromonas frigoriresistens]
MFFDTWSSIYEIILMTVIFYFSLIIMLRISGKRTLADLNAFDMVVTISIGSIVATTILSKDTVYFEGITAIVTLFIMQYIIAKLSVKSNKFTKIVKANPTLVYYQGEFLENNIKKVRVTEDDIMQQMRIEQGITSKDVKAVILEPNGKLSIITNLPEDNHKKIEQYK